MDVLLDPGPPQDQQQQQQQQHKRRNNHGIHHGGKPLHPGRHHAPIPHAHTLPPAPASAPPTSSPACNPKFDIKVARRQSQQEIVMHQQHQQHKQQQQLHQPQGSSKQHSQQQQQQQQRPTLLSRRGAEVGNLSFASPNNLGPTLHRLGKSIAMAVEMFATVGETIGDHTLEIRPEMLDACSESREASGRLERDCEALSHRMAVNSVSPSSPGRGGGELDPRDEEARFDEADFEVLVRHLRCLLVAVTRILLLADNVIVKEILVLKMESPRHQCPKQSPASSPSPSAAAGVTMSAVAADLAISKMHHFTEFVKSFCDFGVDMVNFVYILCCQLCQQAGPSPRSPAFVDSSGLAGQLRGLMAMNPDTLERAEQRKVQVNCARLILERSSTLLISSSKNLIAHPESGSARENRDTVFCQMRRALDLIHFIIKEAIVDCERKYGSVGSIGDEAFMQQQFAQEDGTDRTFDSSTVLKAIKYFVDSVEIMRMSPVSESYKEHLVSCLNAIIELTQDFTDSAHTSHEHRQNILHLCDRAKAELSLLLRIMCETASAAEEAAAGLIDISPQPPSHEVDEAMRCLVETTFKMKFELQQTALEHSFSLIHNCRLGTDSLLVLSEAATSGDYDTLQYNAKRFAEHIDYVEDVSRLIRHVTYSESSQIRAKHAEINLKIYGPQISVAATTLCHDVHSALAKDNLDTFCAMWKYLIEDIILIAKQIQQRPLVSAGLEQGQTAVGPAGNDSGSPFRSNHGGGGVDGSGGSGGSNLNLPVIMKQPPTPSTHHPPTLQQSTSYPPNQPPGFPHSPTHHPHQQQQQHQQQHRLSPHSLGFYPEMHGAGLGPGGLGKFYKSVPNLRSVTESSGHPAGPNANYLHPNSMDPTTAMEARRHSTSCVPGQQYPYPQYKSRPEQILGSYKDVENNEIVKRAKKMAGQSSDMLDFTRGLGKVKTTQDLFTLAEYFAEEANQLYKVIRMFSYDVPTGEDKRALMAIADHVPKHCHTLQMLIQSPIVGKAATFTKVDSIIKETRQITHLIVRVVEICYDNANKYNLDFSNVSMEGKGGSSDDSSQPFGSSSGAGSGASSGNESS